MNSATRVSESSSNLSGLRHACYWVSWVFPYSREMVGFQNLGLGFRPWQRICHSTSSSTLSYKLDLLPHPFQPVPSMFPPTHRSLYQLHSCLLIFISLPSSSLDLAPVTIFLSFSFNLTVPHHSPSVSWPRLSTSYHFSFSSLPSFFLHNGFYPFPCLASHLFL